MTKKPFTTANIHELACPDCPAAIDLVPTVSGVTGSPVNVVTVRHAQTCPWARRYLTAEPVIIHGSMGVLIHHRDIDNAADTPPSAA